MSFLPKTIWKWPKMFNENFEKFLGAQQSSYDVAFYEITQGRKRTHWMWYIFPQLKGLGISDMSRHFAIQDLPEATAFLLHPILGQRLIAISSVLLETKDKTASEIFGSPDDTKLKSSMTLFAEVPVTDPVFQQVLDKYFNGERDPSTLRLLF